jgi:hypothetical protein
MKRLNLVAVFGCAMLTASLGCQPAPTAPPTVAVEEHAPDEHSHAHDHGEEGPHGGHLVDLEPRGVHAEWTHDDDSHQITVYLDDFDAEKISSAKFTVQIADAPIEEFPLARGDSGWSVTSEALMTHLNMGEAATVKLVVVDDTGEQSAKMEPHEHHAH